jgi:hypothetical protein
VVDLDAVDHDTVVSTVDDGHFRRGVEKDCRLFEGISLRAMFLVAAEISHEGSIFSGTRCVRFRGTACALQPTSRGAIAKAKIGRGKIMCQRRLKPDPHFEVSSK